MRATFSLCLKDQFKSKLQYNTHKTLSSVGAQGHRMLHNLDTNFPFQENI